MTDTATPDDTPSLEKLAAAALAILAKDLQDTWYDKRVKAAELILAHASRERAQDYTEMMDRRAMYESRKRQPSSSAAR